MIPLVEAGRWIRNRERNRSLALVWGGLALVTGIPSIVFAGRALQADDVVGFLVLAVVFVLPAIAAGRYAVGVARAGLLITGDSVIVRNPWRTRRMPVSELHSFATGLQPARLWWSPFPTNPTPGIMLELQSGPAYPVWTLATDGLIKNNAKSLARWEGVAAKLNTLMGLGDRPTA